MKKLKKLSFKEKIEKLDQLTPKEEKELRGGSYAFVGPSISPIGVTTMVRF